MKRLLLIVLLAAVGAGTVLSHHDAGRQPTESTRTLPASPKIGKGTGVIQQIDQGKGVVTIKHGPLQGIVIPAMIMSFLVSDKTMLTNLQPLQKVEFEITHENGIYVITGIR